MVPKDKVRLQGLTGALALLGVLCGAAHAQFITITPAGLGNGEVGVAYSQMLNATEVPSSPTCCNWSVSSGALPPGLILGSVINTQNTIGGTPTAAGTFNFSINASDAGHNTIPPQAYMVIISPALGISPASLPAGQQSAIYSVSISATNGIPPYGALQLTGTLPNGLTFTSGSLSGIPTQAGTFPLTATVTDSVGGSASVNYNLSISPPPIVTKRFTAERSVAGCERRDQWDTNSGWQLPILGSGHRQRRRNVRSASAHLDRDCRPHHYHRRNLA